MLVELWLSYLLYGLVTIHFLLAYSTLFSSAKLCSDTGGLFAAVSSYLYVLIENQDSS